MIRKVIAVFLLCLPFALLAQQDKPVILGPVRNGASFEGFVPSPPTPMPIGSGLAGGSIFVLFGSALGPAEIALATVPYPDQLPADPGGTRVTFRSLENEQVYSAPLIHALQYQVSGIVPSPLPVGLAEVTVSYDGMESEPTKVLIVETSPALFTVSQTGRGPAVVQNYESAAAQPLNTLTRPAAPGQYLILWGTGLGPIDGPDNTSPLAGNLREDVTVSFGSGFDAVKVPASYAGRSPEFPGVDQYNVRIPDDGSVELGCYQTVSLEVGNHSFGPQATVAISDTPGECDHPWGLSPERLADLDAGGTANFLHMILSRDFTHVQLAKVDVLGVSQNQAVDRLIPAPFPILAFGGGPCSKATVFQIPTPPGPLPVRPVPPGHFPLDLGDNLSLAGPGPRGLAFSPFRPDPISFGPLFELADDFLVPGDWTLSASGGADVPAFDATFPVRAMPEDLLPESVHLSEDLEIRWDGSAHQEGDRMSISLQPNPEEPSDSAVKALSCRFEATDGSLKISAFDLAWLEASAGDSLLWQLRVEGAPHTFNTEGIDHGQISTLMEIEQPATVVE